MVYRLGIGVGHTSSVSYTTSKVGLMDAEEDERASAVALYRLRHARPLQEGVEVRASRIAGAGRGLFATRAHRAGAVVCEYSGVVWRTPEALRLADKAFLMRLGGGAFVDARQTPWVLARFINDCRGRMGGYNVRFDKRPGEGRADVVAVRDIRAGEELFADYGRLYWLAHNLLHPERPVR